MSEITPFDKHSEQRKDPRWQKLRLKIFERDNFTCQLCKETAKELHVHHKWYVSKRMVWEYPMMALVTLCSECHEWAGGPAQNLQSIDPICPELDPFMRGAGEDFEEDLAYFYIFIKCSGMHMLHINGGKFGGAKAAFQAFCLAMKYDFISAKDVELWRSLGQHAETQYHQWGPTFELVPIEDQKQEEVVQ